MLDGADALSAGAALDDALRAVTPERSAVGAALAEAALDGATLGTALGGGKAPFGGGGAVVVALRGGGDVGTDEGGGGAVGVADLSAAAAAAASRRDMMSSAASTGIRDVCSSSTAGDADRRAVGAGGAEPGKGTRRRWPLAPPAPVPLRSV
ncbi:MAG TPA: hypothetical protein VHU80_02950, partial [Polyangiaceae bacterium]|nr:hypothetical protein [Polyangiaceae bacterium]